MNGLKEQLRYLADKYETKDFIEADPIQFPRKYCIDTDYAGRIMEDKRNVEISGFITAWLSYGNREQIIKTANNLHILMDWQPYKYLMSKRWMDYKESKARLYRFNTYGDFHDLLQRLFTVYMYWNSLEDAVLDEKFNLSGKTPYIYQLQTIFYAVFGIPTTSEKSACKRLAMFLRWMIRRDSPVDMGIWERCQPEKLIIPLDTHVHRQALNLGITKRKSADMRTAQEITDYFSDIFPGDPAKGDFALFGYGVSND